MKKILTLISVILLGFTFSCEMENTLPAVNDGTSITLEFEIPDYSDNNGRAIFPNTQYIEVIAYPSEIEYTPGYHDSGEKTYVPSDKVQSVAGARAAEFAVEAISEKAQPFPFAPIAVREGGTPYEEMLEPYRSWPLTRIVGTNNARVTIEGLVPGPWSFLIGTFDQTPFPPIVDLETGEITYSTWDYPPMSWSMVKWVNLDGGYNSLRIPLIPNYNHSDLTNTRIEDDPGFSKDWVTSSSEPETLIGVFDMFLLPDSESSEDYYSRIYCDDFEGWDIRFFENEALYDQGELIDNPVLTPISLEYIAPNPDFEAKGYWKYIAEDQDTKLLVYATPSSEFLSEDYYRGVMNATNEENDGGTEYFEAFTLEFSKVANQELTYAGMIRPETGSSAVYIYPSGSYAWGVDSSTIPDSSDFEGIPSSYFNSSSGSSIPTYGFTLPVNGDWDYVALTFKDNYSNTWTADQVLSWETGSILEEDLGISKEMSMGIVDDMNISMSNEIADIGIWDTGVFPPSDTTLGMHESRILQFSGFTADQDFSMNYDSLPLGVTAQFFDSEGEPVTITDTGSSWIYTPLTRDDKLVLMLSTPSLILSDQFMKTEIQNWTNQQGTPYTNIDVTLPAYFSLDVDGLIFPDSGDLRVLAYQGTPLNLTSAPLQSDITTLLNNGAQSFNFERTGSDKTMTVALPYTDFNVLNPGEWNFIIGAFDSNTTPWGEEYPTGEGVNDKSDKPNSQLYSYLERQIIESGHNQLDDVTIRPNPDRFPLDVYFGTPTNYNATDVNRTYGDGGAYISASANFDSSVGCAYLYLHDYKIGDNGPIDTYTIINCSNSDNSNWSNVVTDIEVYDFEGNSVSVDYQDVGDGTFTLELSDIEENDDLLFVFHGTMTTFINYGYGDGDGVQNYFRLNLGP